MAAIRQGCVLLIDKPCFALKEGRSPRSKNAKTSPFTHLGNQKMKVEVVNDSYGAVKGQHTFTCRVLEVYGEESSHRERDVGEKFRIKGRNLYPIVLEHWPGEASLSAGRTA